MGGQICYTCAPAPLKIPKRPGVPSTLAIQMKRGFREVTCRSCQLGAALWESKPTSLFITRGLALRGRGRAGWVCALREGRCLLLCPGFLLLCPWTPELLHTRCPLEDARLEQGPAGHAQVGSPSFPFPGLLSPFSFPVSPSGFQLFISVELRSHHSTLHHFIQM